MNADNHITTTSNRVALVRKEDIKECRNTPARAFCLPGEILDTFPVMVGDYDRDKNLEVAEASELSYNGRLELPEGRRGLAVFKAQGMKQIAVHLRRIAAGSDVV